MTDGIEKSHRVGTYHLCIAKSETRKIFPRDVAKMTMTFHIGCLAETLGKEREIDAKTSSKVDELLFLGHGPRVGIEQRRLIEGCHLARTLFHGDMRWEDNALYLSP